MVEKKLTGSMLYLVGGPGNAERVDVSDLFACRLADAGLKVDYVIFDRQPGPAWRKTRWRGATAFVIGRDPRTGLSGAVANKVREFVADIRTFWMALSGPYDAIQIRDKFVIAVLALAACRLRGRKYFYWLSYPYAESRILDAIEGRALVPWISKLGGEAAAWLLYRIVMPRADHVFVQSDQMKRDVEARGVDSALLTPVPMAVSESLLEEPPRPVRPNTILYLGTLIRVRRLQVLIDALKRLHDDGFVEARLILVGDGEHAQDRRSLEQRADEQGVRHFVEFTGMLPMDEAHTHVQRAAICVSPFFPTPLLLSTSPTKLNEYLALGRPVVANAHPEQSATIRESGAGICVEWSVAEFAAAFARLLSDPVEAEAMGQRGRAYVRKHRIYPVIAARLIHAYGPYLGGRG